MNELKPFPGAPITFAAETAPGLVLGDRFSKDPGVIGLSEILNFGMFSQTRGEPMAMRHFLAEAQILRLRLSMYVARRFHGFAGFPEHEKASAVGLVHAFLAGEALVEKIALPLLNRYPELRSIEGQIQWRVQGIQRLLLAVAFENAHLPEAGSRRFYSLLRNWYRTPEEEKRVCHQSQ